MFSQTQDPGAHRYFDWKWADGFLVACCALASLLEAALGLAFLLGHPAIQSWGRLGLGKILLLLPQPGYLLSWISNGGIVRQSSYVTLGIGSLLIAGLMAALTTGIARRQLWAYWTFWSVSCVAIIGRLVAIGTMTVRKNSWAPQNSNEIVILNLLGLALAVATCWYAHQRARASGTLPDLVPTVQKSETEIPTLTLFVAALALLFFLAHQPFVFHRISGSASRLEVLRAVLMALALIGVLTLGVARFSRRFATSAAFGVGLIGLLTLGGIAFPSPEMVLAIFWMVSGGLKEPEFWVLLGFVVSCAALMIVSAKETRPQSFSMGAMVAAALWVSAINPAVMLFKQRASDRYALAHELAKGAPYIVYRTESCLLQYKAKHGGGFPQTLAEVDNAIPGCLQSGLAQGRATGGYRVRYAAKGSAPYPQFSLTALPEVHSPDASITLFADASGVLRTFSGDRPGSADEGSVAPADEFLQIQGCIADFTGRSDKSNKFGNDSTVGYDAAQMHYPTSFAEMAQQPTCFINDRHEGDTWKGAAYRYFYRPLQQNGRQTFALAARPLQYGVTGLRSYFVDDHLIIHATSEDREATEADGWAYRCEFLSLGTPCVDPQPYTRGVSQTDLPADDPKYTPPMPGKIAGRFAEPGTGKLFWNSNQDYLAWAGASGDLQRIYIGLLQKGVLALSSEGHPLWFFPAPKTGLVAGDSLFALNDNGILSRVDATGRLLWSFELRTNDALLEFRDGILYALGLRGLDAISEDGELLWRMQLPGSGAGSMTLSQDGKRLYFASWNSFQAIDVKNGKRLWSIENDCYQEQDLCKAQELANGSVVIGEKDRKSSPAKTLYRLISPSGKVEWSQEYPGNVWNFGYVVPRGTNVIVVSGGGTVQALNARGDAVWQLQGLWTGLAASRRLGLFYANVNYRLTLLNADGQILFQPPQEPSAIGPYGKVHEVGDDLLLVEREYHSLWTVRLPDTFANPGAK
jgi:outer membrane protein assembly factor BamB